MTYVKIMVGIYLLDFLESYFSVCRTSLINGLLVLTLSLQQTHHSSHRLPLLTDFRSGYSLLIQWISKAAHIPFYQLIKYVGCKPGKYLLYTCYVNE